MIDFQALRNKILDKAIRGELVPQLESEPAVEISVPEPENVPCPIPDNWTWVHFSQVATLLNGRAYKKEELLPKGDGLTPVLRVGNFFTNSQWYYSSLNLEESKYCYFGDLLYAWSASFGPRIWEGEKSIYHYHIWKVICSQYVEKKWLYYWFLAKTNELKRTGRGSTMIHITKKNMEQEWLALPPLQEQFRTVDKLESLLSNVDQAERAYESLNGPLTEHLRSLLLDKAIRGELVPQLETEPTVEVENSEIKEGAFKIPSKWKWMSLEKVCSYIQRGKSPKYSDIQKIPVIAQKCNQWDGFHIEKAKFIDPETIGKYKQERLLQDQDILWNSTGIGTLGRLAVYESRLNSFGIAVADSHVTVIRTDKTILDPWYLYFYLSGPFVQNTIEDLSDGSTKQRELATKTIQKYLMPLPPIEEQRRIVKKIKSVLEQVKSI